MKSRTKSRPSRVAKGAGYFSCIVTIDAMGTQTNIAKTIVEAHADYILSVKENQGHLFEDISTLFAVDQAQNFKYALSNTKRPSAKGTAE